MQRVPTITKDEFEKMDADAATWLLKVRYRALADAGVEQGEAALVAVHPEVDVAAAISLVGRGCPARTAIRILI